VTTALTTPLLEIDAAAKKNAEWRQREEHPQYHT
jgi:hypothetical protein